MPLRLKWYTSSEINREKLDRIISQLVKDEYSDKRRWGFTNISSHGSYVQGQYVEKHESIVKLTDPFGNKVEFPKIEFEAFDFIFSTKSPNIELHNSPRSVGGFFNKIASYVNFTIAVESQTVNLTKWLGELQNEVASLMVTSASVCSIPLSNSVQGKVTVMGTTDVRSLVRDLTGNRQFLFSRVQVSGLYHSQDFQCELFADCRATITDGVESEICELLKKSLTKVLQ